MPWKPGGFGLPAVTGWRWRWFVLCWMLCAAVNKATFGHVTFLRGAWGIVFLRRTESGTDYADYAVLYLVRLHEYRDDPAFRLRGHWLPFGEGS